MSIGGDLPDPLTPADCDLRGIEPPWALFTTLAMNTYGVDRTEAEAATNELRRAYWRERAGAA